MRGNFSRTITVALAFALAPTLIACGGDDIIVQPASGMPPPATTAGKFSRADKIFTYLEGKTLLMEGAAIPTHPNGFDENVNFGQATQCYQKVTMMAVGRKFTIVSELGTLMNAPKSGDRGQCDHAQLSAELSFDSTAVLIENVKNNGACFDFTITFPGFGQEGRGQISPDGKKLTLELFFKDQATGHRCADGAVGAKTVTLNRNPFTGNGLQAYSISE